MIEGNTNVSYAYDVEKLNVTQVNCSSLAGI